MNWFTAHRTVIVDVTSDHAIYISVLHRTILNGHFVVIKVPSFGLIIVGGMLTTFHPSVEHQANSIRGKEPNVE